MFKLTKAAADQVHTAAHNSGTDNMALRLAARRKTDGSIEYIMGFDEIKDDDINYKSEGVSITIAPEYVQLLDKTTMDYVVLDGGDASGERQFIFLNPLDPQYVPPLASPASNPESGDS